MDKSLAIGLGIAGAAVITVGGYLLLRPKASTHGEAKVEPQAKPPSVAQNQTNTATTPSSGSSSDSTKDALDAAGKVYDKANDIYKSLGGGSSSDGGNGSDSGGGLAEYASSLLGAGGGAPSSTEGMSLRSLGWRRPILRR